MIGIISWGAYIPIWRLNRGAIADGSKGEKAIGGYDEDSITMAVAAVMDCLREIDRQGVDGLFFATTTSPYHEKLGASLLATAVDLRRDIVTADFSHSLRAGTVALKAAVDAVKSGSAKQVIVVASDCRLGAPGSSWEVNCGDGAVAFLIGDSDRILALFEASYSVCDEIMDVWRVEGDCFIRSAEGRFITNEGYLRVASEAIAGLIKRLNLKKSDFTKAVLGIPNPKSQADLARKFGFDLREELQDGLFSEVGDTGTAYPLMLLQMALEEANENDRFLWVSYGNGSDAISVKVTSRTNARPRGRGLKRYLKSKKILYDYKTYARWRGLLPVERPHHLLGTASPPAYWRDLKQCVRLYGVKCQACGTLQYPVQAVCTKCHRRGPFEEIRFSDRRGTLFTYSIDHVTWALQMPLIKVIINFEGGGRMECLMADTEPNEVKIDMPLEMGFRKIDFRDGIYTYSWKCVPVR
jgi:3-hydroxy-3-methylglutaryl CoA synthase